MIRHAFSTILTVTLLSGLSSSHADPRETLATFFSRAEHYGLSGSILVARGEDILIEKGLGFADHRQGVPARADTAFGTGSITKQFTAAAILHLESQGKLNTNDSIAEYLEFVPEEKQEVTIEHLLTHTSRLGDSYWDQNRTLSEDEYLKSIIAKRSSAEPGIAFQYSNFGYHLLKAIIERVSGVGYETYLRENLFLPNDMQHTGFLEPDWQPNQVARYQHWTTRGSGIQIEDPLRRPVYLHPEGSGGILSTVRDLYKWHRALLNNAVLPPEATTRMFTPHLSNYGYGWRISKTARGTKLIEHGGYDSWIGTLAGFYRYVEDDFVVILLANTILNDTLRHDSLVPQIEKIVLNESVPMPPQPRPMKSGQLTRFTGRYSVAPDESIEIRIQNDRLIASTTGPESIRLLTFPGYGDPPETEHPDTELTALIKALVNDTFDPEQHTIYPDTDPDRFARMSAARLKRIDRKGELIRVRELHAHESVNNGRPNTHHYAVLDFANARGIVRAIRFETGWVAVNTFDLPQRLELTLAPVADNTFHAWDFRIQTGPKLTFTDDISPQLRIE